MRAYERFLKYVQYPTQSLEETGTTPSTAKQLVLARALYNELTELGLCAEVDEFGYVYAHLPANCEGDFVRIGFVAHMDTSADAPDEVIRPSIVDYRGGDITLNEAEGIVMERAVYPYLDNYVGQRLIVTDGTTLLGADDKAGIAEIITMLERLQSEKIAHGPISIAFTPDEEIGEGANHFNVEKFNAEYAYTVDGGALGEVEYENFNAASAKITVRGVSIHPGSAKGMMKNAARIFMEFDASLPKDEVPELTEGYEGFHHLIGMEGRCELATAAYIIRDHARELFEEKKRVFIDCAEQINRKYGAGTLELEITDSYYNMREIIEENMHVVERAKAAMRSAGVEPITVPIRGGTDGARLSFMGLPCPNLSTGGMNFHSRFEFVSIEAMDKMAEVLLNIVTDIVK